MKKLLLTLGSIAAVVAPVTSVIACGDSKAPTTPTKTHTGGEQGTHTNGGNGPAVTNTGTTTDTGAVTNTGTGKAPVQPKADATKLADGIFDFRVDKSLSNADINKIFNKFTTNISFERNSLQGMTARINRKEVDTTKPVKKILILATPDSNNGNLALYAGVISHVKGENGIYVSFIDFKKPEQVSDSSTVGSEKQFNIATSDAVETNILFGLIKVVDSKDIIKAVVDYATKVMK